MDVNLNSNIGLPSMSGTQPSDLLVANPAIIIVLLVIVVLYFFLFSSLGVSSTQDIPQSSNQMGVLGIIIICVFLVLVLLNGTSYFFNIDIIASLKNLFSDKPRIDIDVNYDETIADSISVKTPEMTFSKQVYHVPGNKYTYDDAKAICNATGNRLANYKEIEEAYKNGGDWCSYGWSANQLALFPTQQDKWNKLQKLDNHQNDCGRPGINGGFIDNQNVKFGVNCYGYKPKQSALETELMDNTPLYPQTEKEKVFEKRVTYWKSRIGDILIAPFNNDKWDMGLF
jgi:hypothetical protein